MTKKFLKGLKPLFIQRIALLIGICYIINPLQQQLKTVFHSVSHTFEMPNYVLGHDANSDNDNDHGHYEHYSESMQHDHSLIDLIDAVFTASNETHHSDESSLTVIKIDKHLTAFHYKCLQTVAFKESRAFWRLHTKLKSGHFKKIKEPPQYFIS